MHEQIFIAALIVQLLAVALRPWRLLEDWEPPTFVIPPARVIRQGLWPTRNRKGRYPAGFA